MLDFPLRLVPFTVVGQGGLWKPIGIVKVSLKERSGLC